MEIWARAARFEGLTWSTCWKSAIARVNSLRRRRASPRRYKAFSLLSSSSITYQHTHNYTHSNYQRMYPKKYLAARRHWRKMKSCFNLDFSSPCCSSPPLASTLLTAGNTALNWGVTSKWSPVSSSAALSQYHTPFRARKRCAGTGWLPGGAAPPMAGKTIPFYDNMQNRNANLWR